MELRRIGALVLAGALFAGCGSGPADGGFAPGGSSTAALVGKWKLTRSTGEAKRFFLFSNDGRITVTVYEIDGVEVEMTGTYAADADKIAVDVTRGSKRFQMSGTYAVAGDELAVVSEDDADQVYLPVNTLPNGNQIFRSGMTQTESVGGVIKNSKDFTVDLEIRAGGTWRVVAVGSEIRNGVARPVESEVFEGFEWREVSPGRYLVKKTASSTPQYWRLLGGRALAMERYIMTRVR